MVRKSAGRPGERFVLAEVSKIAQLYGKLFSPLVARMEVGRVLSVTSSKLTDEQRRDLSIPIRLSDIGRRGQ